MSKASMIEELWYDRPPNSASSTLQTYICNLRKLVPRRESATRLVTLSSGYSLHIEPDDVDAHRFDGLVAAGISALDDNRVEEASAKLAGALSIWRGPALGDVPVGPSLQAQVIRLDERRLHALSARIDADLRLGRHSRLISELQALTAEHNLNERFHSQLLVALYRAGRRADALQVYQRLRTALAEHLGLDPGSEVDRVHRSVLMADSRLDLNAPIIGGCALQPAAQLPPDLREVVGHEATIDQIARSAAGVQTPDRRGPGAVVVTGMAGVGKTTIAVRAAQRVRARFPHGQLFATLRSNGKAVDPAEVLENFLRALGATGALPSVLSERVNLFRSWTADRALLVVLDDAESAEQVSALSPTGERCGLIVTSRRRLTELAGVRQVELEQLSSTEAFELFGKLIGADRAAAETRAAERIVELCGGLPLALCSAAASVAGRRGWSLERFAERLDDDDLRLHELRHGNFDVRASISASVARLDLADRRVFVALGSGVATATELAERTGLGHTDAEQAVGRLAEERLLRSWHVDAELYFDVHPLVRLHSAEMGAQRTSERWFTLGRDEPVAPRMVTSEAV
jgi:DNA-binding SARP family transcriptional activator